MHLCTWEELSSRDSDIVIRHRIPLNASHLSKYAGHLFFVVVHNLMLKQLFSLKGNFGFHIFFQFGARVAHLGRLQWPHCTQIVDTSSPPSTRSLFHIHKLCPDISVLFLSLFLSLFCNLSFVNDEPTWIEKGLLQLSRGNNSGREKKNNGGRRRREKLRSWFSNPSHISKLRKNTHFFAIRYKNPFWQNKYWDTH